MSTAESGVAVPLPVRLRLARAAVQVLANDVGADLLHIKGDAVAPELRPSRNAGTDVDILVRPEHVAELDRALRSRAWSVYSTFEHGSPFGHAQTYVHEQWGYLDLHRLFPGIKREPSSAFERLWRNRERLTFGGVDCWVPGSVEQATVLILNAARGPRAAGGDVQAAWTDASPQSRDAIRALVSELDAGTAFAAATGALDDYRGARDYLLWKAVSQRGTRVQEWWGRVRAASSLGGAVAVVLRAPLVNVEHLAHELGRQPTRGEVVREFLARPVRGLREITGRRRA